MDSTSVRELDSDVAVEEKQPVAQSIATGETSRIPAHMLTVEQSIFVMVAILGAVLRFARINLAPLAPLEAATAWGSWLTAHGLYVDNAPVTASALYSSVQTFFFWLGADGDAAARIPAATAGAILCFLPWWWRPIVGKIGALAAACLIAIDPWLLAYSRHGDGTIVSLMLGAVVLTCGVWIVRQRSDTLSPVPTTNRDGTDIFHSDSAGLQASQISNGAEAPSVPRLDDDFSLVERIAAVAFGLLVVSGPLAFSLVIPLLVTLAIVNRSKFDALFRDRKNVVLMLTAGVTGATLLFARWSGIGQISQSATVWLEQFRSQANSGLADMSLHSLAVPIWERNDLEWVALRLLVDQPLLLLLGVLGIFSLLLRAMTAKSSDARISTAVLLIWLVWGWFLVLMPGRNATTLVLLYIPLAIGAVTAISHLWYDRPRNADWRELAALGVVLAILTISSIFWLTALVSQGQLDRVVIQAAATILGFAIVLLVLYGFWSGRHSAVWLGVCWIAAIALAMQLSSSWKLNYVHSDLLPDGFFVQLSNPEIRQLRDDVKTLSAQRTGDPTAIPVQVQLGSSIPSWRQGVAIYMPGPDPLLGWYLRDMQRLAWVHSPLISEDHEYASVAITPVLPGAGGDMVFALPSNFMGSNYRTNGIWKPNFVSSSLANRSSGASATDDLPTFQMRWTSQLQPFLRWIWYRESSLTPAYHEVILWAAAQTQ